MKLIFSLVLSLLFIISNAQQNNRYINDESAADKSLVIFKQQLTAAVKNRDTALLRPLLGDSILESTNGLCGYCSKKRFLNIECIKVDSLPSSDNFWEQAEWHLKLGFAKPSEHNPDYYSSIIKEGKHYVSPPYNYHDNNDSILVIDTDVNVYTEPFATSKIISKISIAPFATVNTNLPDDYDFFIYNQDEDIAYIRIRLNNEYNGYVQQKNTSMIVYKQMTIANINGKWKIVSFYHPPGC